ncbi:MAG: hypothetical protein KDC14_01100, partial [Planctomycetes bacterium]|nr:hypothetical protein [Planctomycetota bacterium]
MLGYTKLSILGIPVLALCAASQGAGLFDSHDAAAQPATLRVDDDGDEVDPRDLVAAAEITLSRAITLALAARPGSAVEAELELEGKGAAKEAFYEVKIVGAD